MSKVNRTKYDPSLRVKVVTEYLQGASAKELYAKYGIKQRTIYEWSKKAKKGVLVSSSDKQGIDFLNSNVSYDNDDCINYNQGNDTEVGLRKQVKELETKIEALEYVFKEFIQTNRKI